ncbi:MAG TPA: ELWxxDGT repeat protein, partial [Thermoanaerobaculia bacterium]|nr:ELWxxDGT repeat protein [Thermoanaerobaculia bacterium]
AGGGADPFTFRTPVVLGSSLFFTADDGVHGSEIWKSDGQPGDAAMFLDLSQNGIYELVRSGDRLFFPANGQLWSTDGTVAGTAAAAGDSHEAGGLIAHTPGRIAYAGATPGAGLELWRADASGAAQIADIRPGADSSSPEALTSVGPVIYFFADDGTTGRELWKSDGISSAEPVKDIRPGAASSTRSVITLDTLSLQEIVAVGTRIFFAADDGVNGEELWTSDGTASGTVRLADINPGAGSSQPRWLTRVRNKLYFVADDGVHGRELWVTDGTAAGTALAKDILPGAGSSVPQSLAAAGPVLLFAAFDGVHGLEPWKSDGTSAGTVPVQDIAPGALPSSPFRFVPSGPNVYFPANDGTHGFELWALPRTALGSTFGDVPTDYWAFPWIEALVDSGITGGCGDGNYCPDRPVSRAESAVFLVRAAHGPLFTPPPPFDMGFNDVPTNFWAAAWIDQLVADGVTSGCGNFNFCPDRSITRAELAVYLLRSRFGETFTPPAGTGMVFGDVPANYWARDWIEHLTALGVTGGCGNGNYCPDRPVTRAESAVFLVRAAHGPLFTPPPPFDMGFNDVPTNFWAAAWIDQLVADGVTSGCGNFNFCPDRSITRAELAVYLLRSRFGETFTPPAGTGMVFGDVPANYWARDWIENLVALGITGGCGNGNYCPDRPVTRAEMAVLLGRMFELGTP